MADNIREGKCELDFLVGGLVLGTVFGNRLGTDWPEYQLIPSNKKDVSLIKAKTGQYQV
jgi:hypothetical protein